MRVTGAEALSLLQERLQNAFGRHLYAVLGRYSELERFAAVDLAQARIADGAPFPRPVNLNLELLARISDDDLNDLVGMEARRPTAVQDRLGRELKALISDYLGTSDLLILSHMELLFAYGLDLSVFRTMASNQNHILLLLPAARTGQTITLYHEAEPRFQRIFPPSLIAEDHLWELSDDQD